MSTTVFNPFESEEISPPYSDEWAARRRVAQALRSLTEVLVTSTPSIDELDEISERLELQARQFAKAPRLFGRVAFEETGQHGSMGEIGHELNAIGGLSNPLSPNLNMWLEDGIAHGTVTCGWAYEGPPEHIHGGFVAAIFDQFLGMAQIQGGNPGMTGTLSVRYLRPTPLNVELRLEARLIRQEGRKTVMQAEMRAGDAITATCEALFVRPLHGMPRRGD
jgi:hypothetical protein